MANPMWTYEIQKTLGSHAGREALMQYLCLLLLIIKVSNFNRYKTIH